MKRVVLVLLLLLAWPVGCRHNTSTTTVTPYQQVMTYNTTLAQTNQDIAKVIEALNAANAIDTPTARVLLTVQFQVAAVDKKLTAILEQGPSAATGQAAEINALIAQINDGAGTLVKQGLVGVKDPAKQQQLANDITAITGLTQLLVTQLKAAGVTK